MRTITVCAEPQATELLELSRQLARELGLEAGCHGDMLLMVGAQGLGLRMGTADHELSGGRDVRVELEQVRAAGGLKAQPLARALGLGKGRPAPLVLDCTAGLGKDAWLAALFGCRVICVERNPAVFALLRDGLRRMNRHNPEAVQRVLPCRADGLELLHRLHSQTLAHALPACAVGSGSGFPLPEQPDTIFLDPMFPGADRRKTKEKKAMRLVRETVGHGDGAGALLQAALHCAAARVVLKLPLKADSPTSVPPTTVYKGKGLKYEVYLPAVAGRTD